jgi:hypothetical protein
MRTEMQDHVHGANRPSSQGRPGRPGYRGSAPHYSKSLALDLMTQLRDKTIETARGWFIYRP